MKCEKVGMKESGGPRENAVDGERRDEGTQPGEMKVWGQLQSVRKKN